MDLDAYLARIGVAPAAVAAPTHEALAALTWGHVSSIPFENLDILLGRPILLDLPSIEAKLVAGRRGGYCFEHNTLMAAVLRELGFTVTTLSARVRWGTAAITPRTHMLLAVDVAGHERQLVDVGFGGTCPTAPLPLHAGEIGTHHDRLRLVVEHVTWHVLQLAADGGWTDLYAFTLEEQHPVDFEVANHFTSTHPRSHFTKGPTVARTTAEGRLTLRGNELGRRCGDVVERRAVDDPDELLEVLARDFGLVFPAGTRFTPRQA